MKLWFQHLESDPYEVRITPDIENMSNIITLIGTSDFFRQQLQIPKDCGSLTLFHNEVKLNPTLLLSDLGVIGSVGNPIIVKIRSPKMDKGIQNLI